MKKFYGTGTYVQSVGVENDMEIDGFSIAVCEEIGVELARHRSRSFDTMREGGEDISSFDLIVALSPASKAMAEDLARFYHIEVEYWPIMDPTTGGEGREARLASYRQSRDQIVRELVKRWGDPKEAA